MCVPVNNDCHTCLQMEATLHKKKHGSHTFQRTEATLCKEKAWFPHVSADGSHTLYSRREARLHRCSEERGVSEDIQHVLTCRHEECLSLSHLHAVYVRLTP